MSSTSVIAAATWHALGVPAIDVKPRRTSGPVLIGPSAAVVALRHAAVVPLGGLAGAPPERGGGRLVAALDVSGTSWWIAADAVWADAATSVQPQRLRPMGLATGASPEQAMVLGISDRLGREALYHLDHGEELPRVATPPQWQSGALYDGGAVTGIPTAVVVGDSFVRWGAGATWELALHRAVDGRTPAEGAASELVDLQRRLDAHRSMPVGVEVGSELLQRAGISRLSVQLVTPHDGLGR